MSTAWGMNIDSIPRWRLKELLLARGVQSVTHRRLPTLRWLVKSKYSEDELLHEISRALSSTHD